MRVLIVDDDAGLRDILRDRLLPHADTVDLAADAASAEAMAGRGYDALLIDIILPDLDGATLIRRLREAGVRSRIVAMSGGGPGRSALEALASAEALGADVVLFKPFDTPRLLGAVFGAARSAAAA
ncbi:response regulator [Azospirillum sp. TSO22-1]|uniref:response regulator n=1 Tax=Azospirillum sp. TSO22-1 TaxID=716789 RepID=UPI000D64CCAF|nr:response regulator [Azospirillum sp. TSO22-1]